ncbi:MAG: alpha/beta fold hydrolase [Roseomonas sp.]|nr:alpha/beta fold hydrolase [Roseomonas sp.]MCA3392957.1 alpha/beta fold hydrolase [Roseomonas sp.]MCA3406003.1 alpha/beta fold hydrolase [Roseomonas sp.]
MNRVVPLPLTPDHVGNALTMAASQTAGSQAGTGRRVTTPAGELAVREAGQGNVPLLLWHGLYAEASMFDPLVKHLAPDYRLLLISAPGHGESGPPALPLSSAMSGAAVLAVLDAFGLESAAVVGCSWGGIAGLQAAFQAPHRISAVAAFNTPFGPGTNDFGTRSIVWLTGALGNTAFFGRRVASGFFSRRTRAQNPAVIEQFVAAFPGRAPRALQAAARAVLIERESMLPLLPKLEVPVLVVSGAEDTRYPPAETQEIARRIPRARFFTVEDSAHLTPLEQPEITARLVRELVPPR